MQLSTALSDGILALVSFYSAWAVYVAGSKSGAAGLALVGIASLAGVFRFSFLEQLAPVHSFFSALAGQVGIPVIGLTFLFLVFRLPESGYLGMIAALLLVLCVVNRWFLPIPLYGIVVAGLGALAIIIASVRMLPSTAGILGIAGAVVLVLAGLAIGTSGNMFGFKRVDLYHYVLSISVGLFGQSLRSLV